MKMSDSLRARLHDAKASLATWYDQLNAQWADAEKRLRSVNLPLDVWVSFKRETQSSRDGVYSRDFDHWLGFMKHDGEWRLCYAVGEAGVPDDFSPRPILDCSLECRTMALEGLPNLLKAFVEEAETQSAKLEAAVGAAAESLASFKAVP